MREERTLEPSERRGSVLKSPTILLSEKAYPYVSPVRREKTPCGHERRAHHPRRNAEGKASGYDVLSLVLRSVVRCVERDQSETLPRLCSVDGGSVVFSRPADVLLVMGGWL